MVVRPGTPGSPRWPGFATPAAALHTPPAEDGLACTWPGRLPFCGVQGQRATGEVRQERSPATPVPVQKTQALLLLGEIPRMTVRMNQAVTPGRLLRSPREDAISIRCACRRAARSADRCPGSRERRRSVQQARKYARSSVGRSKPSGKENCSAHTCTRVSRVPA